MSLEIADFVVHVIEAVGILSLIFAIIEIKRGNDQRFREILSGYLQFMRQTLKDRFATSDNKMEYQTSLLMLDQCMFSVLNTKNKIKMKEMYDELSRLSTALYFGELKEVKEKLQWFKTELFR